MWSQLWGQMIWGSTGVRVPLGGPLAALSLGLLLMVLGRALIRSREAALYVSFSAVALAALVPLSANAVPNVFQNCTVADAGQMNANFAAVEARLAALELKTASISVENGRGGNNTELVFTGVNVNVRNGLGETDGVVNGSLDLLGDARTNGLGNLVIGYNEKYSFRVREGSHNLVVGTNNEYRTYGTLVAGFGNTTSGPMSSVCGGSRNIAEGQTSSISGGDDNFAGGEGSSLSGGQANLTFGRFSSVSGGEFESVNGDWDWRAGGLFQEQ